MTDKKPETDATHHDNGHPSAEDLSVSRRSLLAGAAVGTIAASGMTFGYSGEALAGNEYNKGKGRDRRCKGSTTDIGLVNGRFVDGVRKTFSAMAIRNGRIASIGDTRGLDDGARIVNLGGRTVIPGLINMHVHHSRTGTTPDYEVRDIETAFSIREI